MEARFQSTIQGDLLTKDALFKFARAFFGVESRGKGTYLEFGVLNGGGIVAAYGSLRGYLSKFYGFDTFQGLPKLDPIDQRGLELMPIFCAGNFKSMPRETVLSSIIANANGLKDEDVVLVEGLFEKTLPSFDKDLIRKDGPVLMINVDCDLYSSSKDVFNFIDDLVEDGTWLLLDDYWCYRGSPKFGQRRAFDEWMKESKRVGATEYSSYNGFCKAFILHIK